MATQQLFYERVTPVSAQRHDNWCIEGGGRYEFARHVHSVPLVAVELPHAAREYMIVFGDTGSDMSPLAVLGVKENQNFYVTEEGGWDAHYAGSRTSPG